MPKARSIAVVSALAVAALPGVPAATALVTRGPSCPTVAPPPLAFDKPTFIDTTRAGGEPVSVVAQDGSINVSAHGGTTHVYKNPAAAPGAGDFAVGYANQTLNWRSTDDGKTWAYVGTMGSKFGPHTATSTGFSDPDYAVDAGGRIYNTEIDLANVAVFSSNDDGQSYGRGLAEVTSGDRPWLTAAAKNEVYLYVNTFQQIWRSTDGGLTWTQQSFGNSAGPNAKMYVDPLHPHGGLIGPHNPQGATFSTDFGKTWHPVDGARLGATVDFFGAVSVDRAGNVYRAAAGGYEGKKDTTPNGSVTFNYLDRSTMRWGTPVRIAAPKGDALWPWVVSGDDGRVAVAWLQTLAGHPDKFYVYVAYTLNAHGSSVRCSDGSRRFVPPQFRVANASSRPIDVGANCLDGTACNADPDFDAGDRRLGDFITINFDKNGRLFVVSGDTTLTSPAGTKKPVSNPIFIRQQDGARLLAHPMTSRRTRPVCPLPTC
jgi:photosystem II stability/assembly factor-like uncharacterized protein